TVRLDTFRLSVHNGGPDAAAPLIEADNVPVKTFIDQCADLTASMPLPVNMGQLFGTPQRIAMAYPLAGRYSVEVEMLEVPDAVRIVMDQGAVSGEWTIRVNDNILNASCFESVFLYDHMNIGCDITAYLQAGMNSISVEVELGHDWDGLVDAIYLTGSFDAGFNG
ncbi:hypothetical protein K0U00_47340, partial [Paenibacillus sepulcri]|nr:hypothetical protein [Paenibacillus sepulcri]